MPAEMPAAEGPGGRHPRHFWLVVVGVAAYALGAATTRAFTQPANLLTALPIVALAVLVVIRWPLRPRRAAASSDVAHAYRAWVVLFAAVVAWELATYAARGSRADHPTLSSMADAVDRSYPLKALMFFLWLYLGAAIVRRGRPARVPEPSEPSEPGGSP
jgi:hypothetical protein